MYHQTNRPSQPKRVSAEFLEALKSTPQLPPQIQHQFKENYMPMPMMNNLPRQLHPTKNQTLPQKSKQKPVEDQGKKVNPSRVVEDDISKIAQSYILEGNRLRKYEILDEISQQERPRLNQKERMERSRSPNQLQPGELISFKQKVKLEYLEKKGFLRPQEKIKLQKVRSQQHLHMRPIRGHPGEEREVMNYHHRQRVAYDKGNVKTIKQLPRKRMNSPEGFYGQINPQFGQYYSNNYNNNDRFCRQPSYQRVGYDQRRSPSDEQTYCQYRSGHKGQNYRSGHKGQNSGQNEQYAYRSGHRQIPPQTSYEAYYEQENNQPRIVVLPNQQNEDNDYDDQREDQHWEPSQRRIAPSESYMITDARRRHAMNPSYAPEQQQYEDRRERSPEDHLHPYYRPHNQPSTIKPNTYQQSQGRKYNRTYY